MTGPIDSQPLGLIVRTLSRLRAALVVGGFFVALGAVGVVWLFGRFALSEAVAQQADRLSQVTVIVQAHAQRLATVEQIAKDLAEERVFVRAQLFEIARATGARVVSPPSPATRTTTGGVP